MGRAPRRWHHDNFAIAVDRTDWVTTSAPDPSNRGRQIALNAELLLSHKLQFGSGA